METVEDLVRSGALPADSAERAVKNLIKALGKGVLKVMSKMGISTYQSYCGAQIFDAVGLSSKFIEQYFTGTATQIDKFLKLDGKTMFEYRIPDAGVEHQQPRSTGT